MLRQTVINNEWEEIFKNSQWGKYPPEELIRFIARRYSHETNRKSVKILEVGCGPGANIWYLAREGFAVYGIDGSKTAIHQANLRLDTENLQAELTVGDIINLPYDEGFFDCIIDVECIYANTLADSKNIIEEIYRVLKPEGTFFSKTFMKGTAGDGDGITVVGEPNTYTKILSGPLSNNYGIQRLSSESDIISLYSVFDIESIDYSIRSDNNQKFGVKEWIVICKKIVALR
jgi:SAM-dependent methyltransferase